MKTGANLCRQKCRRVLNAGPNCGIVAWIACGTSMPPVEMSVSLTAKFCRCLCDSLISLQRILFSVYIYKHMEVIVIDSSSGMSVFLYSVLHQFSIALRVSNAFKLIIHSRNIQDLRMKFYLDVLVSLSFLSNAYSSFRP